MNITDAGKEDDRASAGHQADHSGVDCCDESRGWLLWVAGSRDLQLPRLPRLLPASHTTQRAIEQRRDFPGLGGENA